MMFLCGQVNRIWHYWCGRYPGSVGLLVGPSYAHRIPIDPWMPFALDNDAYMTWTSGKPWDEIAWRKFIMDIRMTGHKPIWAAVPDVVANRKETLLHWNRYSDELKRLNWDAAFCVQDGMTPADVPRNADVIFVGGSDRWKFPNLKMWTSNFPRVHCARVNAPQMFESCEEYGCESIDGTGWFREPSRADKIPALERFIEGHRNKTPKLSMTYDSSR